MIKKIYTGIVNLYRAVKKPFFWLFISLFTVTFIPTVITNEVPTWTYWPWIIVGGVMIAFGFISALFHILLGIQLKREGKLDEAGNYIKDDERN